MIGGPVLQRELASLPRGWRIYFLRVVYVGALFGLVATAWLILFGSQPVRSLADLARFGSAAFALISPVQLALAVAFSALLAVAAVAQEKDSRTIDLLLMTRLNNYELVVGKLLASMLTILVLLAAAIPLFMILTLLGGISYAQIARVELVTLAAALAAGSLGSTLALWREKTFQSLATTALAVVVWCLAGEALAHNSFGATLSGVRSVDWAAAFTPFRALLAAMRPSVDSAPLFASAPALGDPPRVFAIAATAAAVLLNLIAVLRVRIWNTAQETRLRAPDESRDSEAALPARSAHAAPGAIRDVWDNPILWREICTWAYGKKVIAVRIAYVAVVAACAWAMLSQWKASAASDAPGSISNVVAPFVALVVLGLVLVNSLSVTSITTERDGRALDLLLVTDLTPKEIIFGKLGGVFFNAKEMLLLPILLAAGAYWLGALGGENFFFLLACFLVANAFVAMLGLHAGMTYANSRTAVGVSLGTVLFLLLGIAVCMRLMVAFQTSFNYQLQAFLAFMVGGGIGLFCALGIRNPSPAIWSASFLAPFVSFYAITSFLQANYAAASLVTVAMYGFATAAMLIPAIAEFDVATGRTTSRDL